MSSFDPKDFSPEAVKFFFEQADKMLSALTTIAESFRTRALAVLTFLAPILLSVFAYAATITTKSVFFYPLLSFGFILLLATWFCLKIVNTTQSYFVGSEPKDIISPEWKKGAKKNQAHNILWNECLNYQERINHRKKQNDDAGKYFRYISLLLFISPIVAIVLYSAILIFPAVCALL